MKKSAVVIAVCILLAGLFVSAGHTASPTKVMINVVEEQGGSSNGAMIKDSEMLIARELINHQMDVMTSDDMSAGKGITEKDIAAARTGSMAEMRKIAAMILIPAGGGELPSAVRELSVSIKKAYHNLDVGTI